MVQSQSIKNRIMDINQNTRNNLASSTIRNSVRISAIFLAGMAGLALGILHPEKAHGYCYKPTPPYKPYTFTTNEQIDSYNRRVDLYNKEVERYRACLSSSYDSYEQRFKEYLRCEARSFGKEYSGCMRPSPPR
jgi:hypothetical protein